jgi:hypothetical protein
MATRQPNPYLVFTSLLFIVPTTTTAYYRQWIPYSASLGLTLASSIYHATKYQPLLIVDKLACYYLTATNLYYALQNGLVAVPVSASLYCLLVFFYGHSYKRFVFAENKQEALAWHISMHLVVMLSVLYGSVEVGRAQKLIL